MPDRIVLDEFANYHYKDLQEMLNSPEHKRLEKLIRRGVAAGSITIYPPLPPENKISSESPK